MSVICRSTVLKVLMRIVSLNLSGPLCGAFMKSSELITTLLDEVITGTLSPPAPFALTEGRFGLKG